MSNFLQEEHEYDVQDRTIINNIITTLTTNNYIKDLSPDEEQISTQCCAAGVTPTIVENIPLREHPSQNPISSILAAPAGKTDTIIDPTIPHNWDYIKLDLFNNATLADLAKNKNKFKLNISIKVKGMDGWQNYRAALNSPFRNLKRGLDTDTYNNPHYTAVQENYKLIREQCPTLFVSKAYEKGHGIKGQTVEELTVILVQTTEGYSINLHFLESNWFWDLSESLTPIQRKKNMIASVGIRKGNKVKNLSARKLLG